MYRVFPSLEPLFPSGYTLVGNDEGRLLSRCRMKLHPFGIEIKSLTTVGYALIPVKGRARVQTVAVS